VIAAALTALAQFGVVRHGGAPAWPAFAAHCAAAGLAYLLFVNLTKRKLGAPLIAAVLFGAHPAALAVLRGDDGWLEPTGTALGLLSGVLLARTPLQPRLLWPALAAYAASLPTAPGAAFTPFLVAAAIVAYHGLEPARLFTKRLLPRFAVFVAPLAAWATWTIVAGSAARPAIGSVPAFVVGFVAPFGSTDARSAVAGVGIVATLVALGLLRLRATPKAAWPLLAAGASLAAGALLADVWGDHRSFLAALAFVSLVVAEGIEELFFRFSAAVAMPLLVLVYAALAVQSHFAAAR
jgi:hypothetical protein